MIDILRGFSGTGISGAPTGHIDGIIGLGPYFGAGGTGDDLQFTGNAAVTDDNVLLAYIIRGVAIGGGRCWVLSTSTSTGSGWTIGNSNTNFLELFNWGWGSINSSFTFTNGVPYFVAASGSVSAGVFNFILLNLATGQLQAETQTAAPSSSGASNGTYAIGSVGGVTGAQGYVAAAMFAPSFLSLPQMVQWASDPWSFWYPSPASVVAFDPAFIGGAVAAGDTLGCSMQVLMM